MKIAAEGSYETSAVFFVYLTAHRKTEKSGGSIEIFDIF